jgi:hypothetical protein
MSDLSNAVLQALSTKGLLLLQDKQLPNVVTLVTGDTPRGSWWSHPKGRLVFGVLTELEEHPDVLFTKLLGKKVTLVHRTLWPPLLTVMSAGEPWQLRGLSEAARRLLASVNEQQRPVPASGAAVKELETRLLVHTQEVHTETGRHELMVQPWAVWARHAKVKPLRSMSAARERIEKAAEAIGADLTLLPWRSRKVAT